MDDQRLQRHLRDGIVTAFALADRPDQLACIVTRDVGTPGCPQSRRPLFRAWHDPDTNSQIKTRRYKN
jgi:hypothetical protein